MTHSVNDTGPKNTDYPLFKLYCLPTKSTAKPKLYYMIVLYYNNFSYYRFKYTLCIPTNTRYFTTNSHLPIFTLRVPSLISF